MLKQTDNQQAAELTQARDLANRGQLQAAETICQKLQQSNAYDSDLLCLQGVIQQAYGNLPLAESYYHKSLFVAPNHVESLTHLMLLHQLRGEHEQTMNYQRRLKLSKSQGS
jgi:chemotaxis protein methyltransferase WspC